MKRHDTACYLSPYDMKMHNSQLQTKDPHWNQTFLAPSFQISHIQTRKKEISVKPPFCSILAA